MKPIDRQAPAGALFELDIEKLVNGGDGLGRHEGKVVFVPYTVPGDRVEVRPVERRRSYTRAALVRMVRPGPGRVLPPCPHFGRCGGCQWQHMEYELQCAAKRMILEEVFHHHFPETRELRISMKACPAPFGYRSRARVQLRGNSAKAIAGFYRFRSRDVEDVEACPLLRPALNEALRSIRGDQVDGRFGPDATEIDLACTEDGNWACAEAGRPSETILLRQVGEYTYALKASVFFQANGFLLSDLVQAALGAAAGGEAALDLFSGVGLFSLPMAARFRGVIAVEGNTEASRLCARNASGAGLDNIDAVCADVLQWSEAVGSVAAPAFDCVLLDPPRTGAGPAVMRRLLEWAPENIVYVSCDPQTQVRDLSVLSARDYRIDSIDGLDMFPQTYHMETVVRLKRR